MKFGRLHQAVRNLFAIGATTANSIEKGGVQRMQIMQHGATGLTKDPVPSLQQVGFASAPLQGANLVVIHLDGNQTKGVIVATDDPRYRPAPAPGEAMMYSTAGAVFHADAEGNCIITPIGGKRLIVNGDAFIEGNLMASGTVVEKFGSEGAVGLGTHTHKQSPDAGGNAEVDVDPPTAGT
ncbi:hypothetical protein FGG78_28535 [Thioclava sp. BHET1]|nr:hypothetical protein FGG78_28535 [Thioclava sp. BHET1]